MNNISHIAFADESNWNTGRFRSICLLTIEKEYESEIADRISDITNSKEIKWSKINSNNREKMIIDILELLFGIIPNIEIKIDVIMWDTYDSRHSIKKRDDNENLVRMYYHLLKYVFTNRWSDEAIWIFHPDEHSGINWNKLHTSLQFKSIIQEKEGRNLFNIDNYDPIFNDDILLKKVFHIEDIKPAISEEKPLVQLADIFAGMSWFSREQFKNYKDWQDSKNNENNLFAGIEDNDDLTFTNTQTHRFPILERFINLCKKGSYYVSFSSSDGLKTFNRTKPFNFWWYEPQTNMDKAPTKDLF